jgi:hypothetical protein
MDRYNIIVTAGLAHGTTHICNVLDVPRHRYDRLFWNLALPPSKMDEIYQEMKNEKGFVLSVGALSQNGFFAAYKDLKAIGLVRHPLLAMESLYLRKHPEKVKHYGTYQSEELVIDYSAVWNNAVADILESGMPIIRFEYAWDDIKKIPKKKNRELYRMFKNWRKLPRRTPTLKPDLVSLLKRLVCDDYKKLYPSWEI